MTNQPTEYPNEPNPVSPGSELDPSTRLCPTIPMDDHQYQPDDQAISNRKIAIRRAAAMFRRAYFELTNLEAMVAEDQQDSAGDQALINSALSIVRGQGQ